MIVSKDGHILTDIDIYNGMTIIRLTPEEKENLLSQFTDTHYIGKSLDYVEKARSRLESINQIIKYRGTVDEEIWIPITQKELLMEE